MKIFKDAARVVPGIGGGGETCLFLLMSTQANSMVEFKVIVLSTCFNVIKFSCSGVYS